MTSRSRTFDAHHLGAAVVHHRDDFGKTERADHRRKQSDAALHFGETEREAVGHVEAFLADHRHRKTEEAGDPALERIFHRRQLAGDQHAENREPQKFMGLKFQRIVGELWRDQGQRQHADHRAEERTGGGRAHRRPGAAHARQRIAVERRGGVGRRSGNIEKNGGAAAAINRADVKAHQRQQRGIVIELVSQRRQQREPHGRGQSRQDADDNSQQRRAGDVNDGSSIAEFSKRGADIARRLDQITADVVQKASI